MNSRCVPRFDVKYAGSDIASPISNAQACAAMRPPRLMMIRFSTTATASTAAATHTTVFEAGAVLFGLVSGAVIRDPWLLVGVGADGGRRNVGPSRAVIQHFREGGERHTSGRRASCVRRRRAKGSSMRATLIAAMCLPLSIAGLAAQLPLSPPKTSGLSVTPAFEGWYKNPDGSYSISFGYYNRNVQETLEIPIGPDNFITPGDSNQGQPTHFEPRRNWGVFAVRVPKDFGDKKVVWTLRIRGETFAIPGSLHPNWQIDALEGEAGSGNTPPVLKFAENGPEGAGPGGIKEGDH